MSNTIFTSTICLWLCNVYLCLRVRSFIPLLVWKAQCGAFTLACECTGSIHHIYSLPTPVSLLKTFLLFTPNQSCPSHFLVHYPLKNVQNRRKRHHQIYSAIDTGESLRREYTDLVTKGGVKRFKDCTTVLQWWVLTGANSAAITCSENVQWAKLPQISCGTRKSNVSVKWLWHRRFVEDIIWLSAVRPKRSLICYI